MHNFKRDNSKSFCYVCQDKWPVNEGNISKYHHCDICDITVHTACRSIAKQLYVCKSDGNHIKFDNNQLRKVHNGGRIVVKLLHAYDIQLPTGTNLYGLLHLSSSTASNIRTTYATVDRNGCVWSSDEGEKSSDHTNDSLLYQLPKKEVSGIATGIGYDQQLPLPPPPPTLEVGLWKGLYRLFDTMVASCSVNLIPLMLHPNEIIERWFGLINHEGEKSGAPGGMILLSMLFIPQVDSIIPPLSHPHPTRLSVPPMAPTSSVTNSRSSMDNSSHSTSSMMTDISSVTENLPTAESRTTKLILNNGITIENDISENGKPKSNHSHLKVLESESLIKAEIGNITEKKIPLVGQLLPLFPILADNSSISSNAFRKRSVSLETPTSNTATTSIASFSNSSYQGTLRNETATRKSSLIEEDLKSVDPTLLSTTGRSQPLPLPLVQSPLVATRATTSHTTTANGMLTGEEAQSKIRFALPTETVSSSQYQTSGSESPLLRKRVRTTTTAAMSTPPATSSSSLISPAKGYSTAIKSNSGFQSLSNDLPNSMNLNGINHTMYLNEDGWSEQMDMYSNSSMSRKKIDESVTPNRFTSPGRAQGLSQHPNNNKQKIEVNRNDNNLGLGLAPWIHKMYQHTINTLQQLNYDDTNNYPSISHGYEPELSGSEKLSGGLGKGYPMDTGCTSTSIPPDTGPLTHGVGRIHLHLISAHKSQAHDAAEGDHYVTVNILDGVDPSMVVSSTPLSASTNIDRKDTANYNNVVGSIDQTVRSHTVMSSATPFFNRKWQFIAPHYRAAIRLTLYDATSDKKIGISTVSVYELMQRDADRFGCDWRRASLENIVIRDSSEKEVIGYFNIKLSFEEDYQGLFASAHPRLAPLPPPEQFSLERLRIHISRAKEIIGLFGVVFREYKYIMNWENPFLTTLLLVLFLHAVFRVNAEYALCCPLFVMVSLLSLSWFRRKTGAFRRKWVEKGEIPLPVYRPVAFLRIAVIGCQSGRPSSSHSFSSLPTGSPLLHANTSSSSGNTMAVQKLTPFVKISYILLDSSSANATTTAASTSDSSASRELLIGCINLGNVTGKSSRDVSSTGSGGGQRLSKLLMTSGLLRSENTKDALLQNFIDAWPKSRGGNLREEDDMCYLYPILQPLLPLDSDGGTSAGSTGSGGSASKAKRDREKTTGKDSALSAYLPWSRSEAMLKFTLSDDNPLSSFIDSSWGYVKVPLRDLVTTPDADRVGGLQEEVSGWYKVTLLGGSGSGNQTQIEPEDSSSINISETYQNTNSNKYATAADNDTRNSFYLSLRMRLELKDGRKEPSNDDIENSRALQSILASKDDKGGTTISAIWNIRDNVKYVQNLLSSILDSIESVKNILLWVYPSKTLPLYLCLVGAFFISLYIPGRYIILAVGLYEFFYKFMPEPEDLPMNTRFNNLLMSTPNDDDLDQVYHWERKAHIDNIAEQQRLKLKHAKLRLVFECQWEGMVRIKGGGGSSGWEIVYLAVQGHRLVWWSEEDDVDKGRAPCGQLLLQGHAGVTQPSPLDLREIGDESRLVAVFGRDQIGCQQKYTIVCKDSNSCAKLVLQVERALGRN